jgi:hypothetical protein
MYLEQYKPCEVVSRGRGGESQASLSVYEFHFANGIKRDNLPVFARSEFHL